MDKRVVLSVAGSGKTSLIVDRLVPERRFLIISHTANNIANLRQRIMRKFGHFPSNITLRTYFSFLYTFCYRPFFAMRMGTRGINYDFPPEWTRHCKRTEREFYVDGTNRLYSNRIAKLIDAYGAASDVRTRLQKYFDVLCVDEVQDFGGHDFNLLMSLCRSDMEILLTGDFYQHTFDTSRDGPINQTLYAAYEDYQQRFRSVGVAVDTQSLSRSYRCSKSVCEFIREHLGVEIHSHSDRLTEVSISEQADDAARLYACENTAKLFYQEHEKYECRAENWGKSKGIDHYQDVCVVLTGTALKALKAGTVRTISPQTRNKLYVACTRARGNLYLLPEAAFRRFKTKDSQLPKNAKGKGNASKG